MEQQSYELLLAGKTLSATFTNLADQANGSVIVRYGETAILVTAVMSDQPSSMPYFPLSVEFEEKFYAAGQILGSRFMRREGRPSDESILSARIIDRTIRPLFDQRIRHDIQIVVTVLAMGEDDPDVLGIIGASLALSVSDIPWHGPVGAARIGLPFTEQSSIINPTYTERMADELQLELLACGHADTINMVEAASHEVAESSVVSALETALPLLKQIEEWQINIQKEIGRPKREITIPDIPEVAVQHYQQQFATRLYDTVFSSQAGKKHIETLKDEFLTTLQEAHPEVVPAQAAHYFETQINAVLHQGVITDGKRADGRRATEVRSLYAQAGEISPVLHGSGIFYRGGTHIFTALTLGGPNEAQLIDTIEEQDTKKHFLHHYNFPPFSVGSTGRVGGFNRRMIGHGALAEKALLPVIPTQDTFPYTIRLVSETMASNGSSSMGSVCAASLALMDGGVPITRPVAGIASGVMIDGDAYQLLTDIQGPEDEHGDMDFKVAGTREGVTAIQMDVKVSGIPIHILKEALTAAKVAREEILTVMENTLAAPRTAVSPRAPEIVTLTINPEQIGLVIGSGGKTINGIKEDTAVEDISIEDDGTIYITGRNGTASVTKEKIQALTKVYSVNEETQATITKLTDFGAFAKLSNEQEGLIHISEIATFHIGDVNDVLHVGQTVPVVVTKIEHGKIGLSIKQADDTFIKES